MNDLVPTQKTELERKLGGTGLRSLRNVVAPKQVTGVLLLLDYSGSMSGPCATGEPKVDALRTIVADVRHQVIVPAAAFGPYVGTGPEVTDVHLMTEEEFATLEVGGGTPMAEAIAFGTRFGATHLIVVSDGGPDNPQRALAEATAFGGKIDAIYVGPDGDGGAQFMAQLAALTGGARTVSDLAERKLLVSTIKGYIGDGTPAARGAIQL